MSAEPEEAEKSYKQVTALAAKMASGRHGEKPSPVSSTG
jgi:hypothetical protein